MVKKIIRFDMYIKTSEQTPTYSYVAKQKVMSNDKDSTQITFNLLDVSPDELSGSSASILLYMQDGSFFQSSDVTIDRNSVIYTMKEEETKHSGNTKVQIVLKKGTVQTASLIYNFEIEKGLEKYPITEVMIQDWTTLTEEAKAFVEQIEGFTLEQFVENKMGQELANLEVNYATRLTGLEQKDNQLTAQLAQAETAVDNLSLSKADQSYVDSKIGDLGAVATFKGSDTHDNILAKTGMSVGDEWYDITNGKSLRWNGLQWVEVGGTVRLSTNTITEDHATFFKKSKNLFNYETALEGYSVNNLNGQLAPNASFSVSDFIPITPGSNFVKHGNYAYAFYRSKSLGSFVSGGTGPTGTAPTDGNYIRFSIHSDQNLKEVMLVEGTTLGPYVPYEPPKISGENVDFSDSKIAVDEIEFISKPANYYDSTTGKPGYYVTPNTGEMIASADYTASDYIDTPPGQFVSNRPLRFVAFFNSNYDHVGGLTNVAKDTGFSVPDTASKTVVSVAHIYAGDLQIKQAIETQHFKPHSLNLVKPVFSQSLAPVGIALPDILYGVVGQTINIYFDNIISEKSTYYDFKITGTAGRTYKDRWSYTPSDTSSKTFDVQVYQFGHLVAYKKVVLIVSDIGQKDLTALVFGDSTVNANYMTQRLLDLYDSESSNLTLLGTRGIGLNRSEGRGGWGAATYRTGASIYGSVNPFYDPIKQDFSFSYYMSNQGYATPDHFIIQLGINDTIGYTDDESLYTAIAQIKADLDYIIDDVKSYDSAIKVGITITIPPNADQDAFAEAYGNTHTEWRYKRNNFIWTRYLIDTYQYREAEGIYLIPMHHNIDRETDFVDAVHPKYTTDYGYGRMGDSIYSYLKRIG